MSRGKHRHHANANRLDAISRRRHRDVVAANGPNAMSRRKRSDMVDSEDSDFSVSHDDEDDEDDVSLDGVKHNNDDIFDTNEDRGETDTDATDMEDPDCEDQLKNFAGNRHPPEYYQQMLETFNDSEWEVQHHSEGTTALLDRLEEQWRSYCDYIERDPRECYEKISLCRLYSFFDWMLNQKFGKKDRRKPGIKKMSTLETYWKIFCLVFTRAMHGTKIQPKICKSMPQESQILRKLAKTYNLSREKRPNRCLPIDQLKIKVKETLGTTEKMFKVGELRIYAVLFLLLLSPAGSRPNAILHLKMRHIRVALVRDPEGGPHNTLLRFTPEFTKTYLGEKDATTFPIPETLFDPSLLLSPHVFLLGILFRHRAFRAPHLTSGECLEKLDIHPDEFELPLPLKEELNDVYLFRQAVLMSTGYEISANTVITYAMIKGWLQKIAEILGWDFIFYSLRYNAANSFDQSTDVSEALRNLAMGHSSSSPFQKHYLGRNISADLWGILRGLKPQTALVKQSCSIGHSMSKRRPTGLTKDQVTSIDDAPTIATLIRRLEKVPKGSEERKNIKKRLQSERLRLRRKLLKKTRDEWTPKQATDDIERQLKGKSFPKPAEIESSRPPQRPAQKRLLEALTAPVTSTLEGQYSRRNKAISAVSAYCYVQEGCTPRRSQARSTTTAVANTCCDPPKINPLTAARNAVMVNGNKSTRPRECFMCIGQALHRPTDYDPNLLLPFYTSNDLTKHFKRRHLKKGATLACNICGEVFKTTEHFRRHAQEVHGTLSGKMKEM